MVLPFFCKAVTTGQITVMGNMQAKCLYYSLTLLKV